MKVLYCDVCKKPVENPVPTRSIFHIADIDICEPCRDELEAAVKYTSPRQKTLRLRMVRRADPENPPRWHPEGQNQPRLQGRSPLIDSAISKLA